MQIRVPTKAFVLFVLSYIPLVLAQDERFGYLEGKIIAIDGNTATVQLSAGETVAADLGTAVPGDMSSINLPDFKVGERVELYYAPGPDGTLTYAVSDWVRRPVLLYLTLLFLFVSVAVARFKGLRAFLATGASLFIIMTFIVPRILAGWNPTLVSLLGVGGILILAIYFVHGLSWSTTAALIGTYVA
ncbi:MAG: YibE/F family protein, partial [Trueperaceae bacterium]|nr:YibE/F family protein [Trueperaceae bacterium]